MKEFNVLEALRQASLDEVGAVFHDCVREIVKESFVSIMLEETAALCGAFYHPDKGSRHRRGGSADGY